MLFTALVFVSHFVSRDCTVAQMSQVLCLGPIRSFYSMKSSKEGRFFIA